MSGPRVLRLVVTDEARGDRADRWIASMLALEGVSRSAVTRLCDEGAVTLRGDALKASARLKRGDEVVVTLPLPAPSEAEAEAIPLDVVYEDEHLLVVDKPAGMVVHPARGHARGTLVNAVLGHAELEADEGADPLRPGIVHRIDRMTSGLLVVAKTVAAREGLAALFKTHDIHRVYLALIEGVVGSVRYDTLHDRHPVDRLRFTTRTARGRRAITEVQTAEVLRGGAASLVRCTLETGRTHQIRVHLADHGHPLIGDALYGRRAKDPVVERVARALGRQALHAAELGFEHPVTHRPLRLTSALPADLQVALAELRAQSQ